MFGTCRSSLQGLKVSRGVRQVSRIIIGTGGLSGTTRICGAQAGSVTCCSITSRVSSVRSHGNFVNSSVRRLVVGVGSRFCQRRDPNKRRCLFCGKQVILFTVGCRHACRGRVSCGGCHLLPLRTVGSICVDRSFKAVYQCTSPHFAPVGVSGLCQYIILVRACPRSRVSIGNKGNMHGA